jgi:hypothetical protein
LVAVLYTPSAENGARGYVITPKVTMKMSGTMIDKYLFIPILAEAMLPSSSLEMALLARRDHVLTAYPARALPERPYQSFFITPPVRHVTGKTEDLIAG